MSIANTVLPSALPTLLDQFRREKFYGRVSFDLRAGEVTLIRTERTQLVKYTDSSNHEGANQNEFHPQHDR